ncbi:MAG: vanadium-dependent haloperoxidase [Actinomycetota bacterium]|nr:vanadium-dependent haloperoxidase [Actinomycetota bacterium]
MRSWSAATWLHWILRVGILFMYVGHGGFGLIGKAGWLPYFNAAGLSDSAAWKLMPIIGAIDVTVGIVTFLRPMRAVLVYSIFWTVMTAVLRPLAGQGVWEEVFERAGNFGLPLALLVLVGMGNGTVRGWYERARPRPFDLDVARTLSWVLRILVALLLIGHGAFGLDHLHDQEWTTYFGVLGVGPDAIISSHLIALIGWFEIALAVAILIKPFRGLVLFVLAWKVGAESLRLFAGEPVGEFVERAGDFFLPLALFVVQGWLIAHRLARHGPRVPVEATGRRPLWRAGAWVGVCAVLVPALVVFRGGTAVVETRDVALRAEPGAGNWQPWVLASPDAIPVPPPPEPGSAKAKADAAEMKRFSIQRSSAVRKAITKWSGSLPTKPWTAAVFDFVSTSAKNPPLSSRNYALVHVAMYDAVIAAWHWKYHYNVAPPRVNPVLPPEPDPSYPSEHAAIAGAASRVLAYLYPNQSALRLDEMAEQAGLSRVQAGVNTPSDVAAGLDLGRAVAEQIIARAKSDGSDKVWDGTRPPGIGGGPQFWEPPPGSVSPPIAPLAGSWKTWVMRSPDQFRPPPPPAYGSPAFVAAAQEVIDVKNHLTPEERQIAKFYEGAEGTKLPAGIVVDVSANDVLKDATSNVASRRLTVPRVARALALVTIALADAGVAVWDAKYTYWDPRPQNSIRALGLDPNWTPMLPTPRFPAFPSGSAGYAGAAQAVMTYLFPDRAAEFKRRAEDQAVSRLYAGIHWRHDSVSIDMGRKIGALVIDRAKRDGA